MEMKVYCADDRCKYCDDGNRCTAKMVKLNFEGLNTVYQGFREVHICETFEESEFYKQVREFMRDKTC